MNAIDELVGVEHARAAAVTGEPGAAVRRPHGARTADLVEREGLASRRVRLDVGRRFRDAGYARLDSVWGVELAAALAVDALDAADEARPPESGPRTPVTTERANLSRVPVATTPLLDALHQALAPMARTLTGRLVVPSFAVYGYFAGDDECILHYDTDASDITLLVMALGQVAPLHIHPELRGLSVDELGRLECDPSWDRQSGVPIEYSRSGLTAICGRVLPHHRPKGTLDGLSAVAALHYQAVFRPASDAADEVAR